MNHGIGRILSLLREAAGEKSLKKRFLGKVTKRGGHWLWTKGHTSSVSGKPQCWFNGRVYPAGRIAYLLWKGKVPEPGRVVKNTCGKKNCVNPNHLSMSKSKDTLELPPKEGNKK